MNDLFTVDMLSGNVGCEEIDEYEAMQFRKFKEEMSRMPPSETFGYYLLEGL